MYLLHRAADITGGAYWSTTFTRLEAVFLRVLEAANARYLLSYEPEGTVRVAGPVANRRKRASGTLTPVCRGESARSNALSLG
jgi:hypothetical protein